MKKLKHGIQAGTGRGLQPHPALRAVLFDFDGTLVKLNADFQGLRGQLKTLLEPYGFFSSFRNLFQSVKEAEDHIKSVCAPQVAGQIISEIWDAFYRTEQDAIEHAELLAGVPEIWQWLTVRNVPIAIVSNNHSDIVKAALTRLEVPLPPVVIGRDHVRLLKPDPEGALLALEDLGLTTQDVWMVGDSLYDAEAGAALKLQVALVDSPWQEPVPDQNQRIHRLNRIDVLISIWTAR